MNERRRFIMGCAVGVSALATPLGLYALDDGFVLSADTYRDMIGKGFMAMDVSGYEVRLRLVDVWEKPAELGAEQFTLVFKETGASGPPLLSEGLHDVYNRKLGELRMYIFPSDTLERHYVSHFSLL